MTDSEKPKTIEGWGVTVTAGEEICVKQYNDMMTIMVRSGTVWTLVSLTEAQAITVALQLLDFEAKETDGKEN